MEQPLGTFRLKVVSDGTRKGTFVINPATGERLEHVAKIEWTGMPFEYSSAAITLRKVALELDVATTVVLSECDWAEGIPSHDSQE
jgi:hypothetical protein